jgi:hypothetical protein
MKVTADVWPSVATATGWQGPTQIEATLAGLPEGWVACRPNGRYRVGGNVKGHFWHAIGLGYYEVGELDDRFPGLRLGEDEPLLPGG